MLYLCIRPLGFKLLGLALLTAVLSWIAVGSSTRVSAHRQTSKTMMVGVQSADQGKAADDPPFREYRGVSIGMSADEARRKLGTPKEKSDQQDFFVFSEKESAQIFYDGARKVSAISVDYVGEGSGVPKPKDVFGTEIEAKADGTMYKMVRYPKAGYWVSFNRTAGPTPLISITLQKIAQ